MSQSRSKSMFEAATNVAVGFGIALVTQVLAFPALGIPTSLRQNAVLSGVFTVVSLVRGYLLRRLFETASHRPGSVFRERGDG